MNEPIKCLSYFERSYKEGNASVNKMIYDRHWSAVPHVSVDYCNRLLAEQSTTQLYGLQRVFNNTLRSRKIHLQIGLVLAFHATVS